MMQVRACDGLHFSLFCHHHEKNLSCLPITLGREWETYSTELSQMNCSLKQATQTSQGCSSRLHLFTSASLHLCLVWYIPLRSWSDLLQSKAPFLAKEMGVEVECDISG